MFKRLFALMLCVVLGAADAATTTNLGMTYLNNAQAQPDVPINDAWNKLDIAASGLGNKLALTLTGNVTLTSAQAAQNPWILGGAPGSNVTITTPASTSFVRAVYNNTGKTATITPSGGTGFTLPIGASAIIFSDGSVAYQIGRTDGVFASVTSQKFIGNSSAPGIAAGAGDGTGGTCSLAGTDAAGVITAATGTLPSNASTVCTVTFSAAYGSAPYVIFSANNNAAAALSGVTMVFMSGTTTTFVITSGATGLAGSTSYQWNYHVMQ